MSNLKTKRVQIGDHSTASNNFVMHQSDTPDGKVHISNGTLDDHTSKMTLTHPMSLPNLRCYLRLANLLPVSFFLQYLEFLLHGVSGLKIQHQRRRVEYKTILENMQRDLHM